MAAVRACGSAIRTKKRLIDLADHILGVWRDYTDEAAFIYAETDGEPHNTSHRSPEK